MAEKGGEVLDVVRLEHQLGKPAGPEPGDAVHRRVRRQAPAHILHGIAEIGEQLCAIYLLHAFFPRAASSFGSAAAQLVMLPAPSIITKSPGSAIEAT